MSDKPKIDNEDSWLLSDGQLWARTQSTPNKKGILLSVEMPWGLAFKAQVEKLSAATVTEFCDLARGCYYARKEEQAAAKARAASERAIPVEPGVSSEIVQGREASLSPLNLDPESILQRVDQLDDEACALRARLIAVNKERDQLQRIVEVLDAPENNAKEPEDIPRETSEVSNRSTRLAQVARENAAKYGGEGGTSEEDA